MKIAVATDDSRTISKHFGRASGYLVFTIEEGKIVEKAYCEKAGHEQFAHEHHAHEQGHGFGTHSADKHARMIEPIRDCDVVMVRGMGQGAYHAIQQADIHPIVTDLEDAEEAVHAYIGGTLVDHPEWLH